MPTVRKLLLPLLLAMAAALGVINFDENDGTELGVDNSTTSGEKSTCTIVVRTSFATIATTSPGPFPARVNVRASSSTRAWSSPNVTV